MEYKLLEEKDLSYMEEVLSDDNMVFNISFLKNFIINPNTYGFLAKENNKIFGFTYAYTLLRPDNKKMFYLHSIGLLPDFQGKVYCTELLSYIKDY